MQGGRGLVGRRLLRRVALEVREPGHQALVPAQDVLPRHVVEPEHEAERAHAHRVGVLAEQVGLAPLDEPVDQLVGQPRDHALRAFLDVARAERHLGDRPDPPLLRAFHAEHVLAHRAVQRRGLGRGGERLGVGRHALHVVVAGDEPEADGRDEAHGLLVAQACVDRVGVALERLQRDRLADRHRCRRPLRARSQEGVFCARTTGPRKLRSQPIPCTPDRARGVHGHERQAPAAALPRRPRAGARQVPVRRRRRVRPRRVLHRRVPTHARPRDPAGAEDAVRRGPARHRRAPRPRFAAALVGARDRDRHRRCSVQGRACPDRPATRVATGGRGLAGDGPRAADLVRARVLPDGTRRRRRLATRVRCPATACTAPARRSTRPGASTRW